mgnify:FL=1
MLNLIVALPLLWLVVINGEEVKQRVFNTIHNSVLVGSAIATYHVSDELQCSHKCLMDNRCLSFNYGIKTSTKANSCEINSSNELLDRGNLIRSSQFNYYGSVSLIFLFDIFNYNIELICSEK